MACKLFDMLLNFFSSENLTVKYSLFFSVLTTGFLCLAQKGD
jgi:hypothetical protein